MIQIQSSNLRNIYLISTLCYEIFKLELQNRVAKKFAIFIRTSQI